MLLAPPPGDHHDDEPQGTGASILTRAIRTQGELTPRILAVAGVAGLHGLVYLLVTRLTLLRPTEAFIHPRIALDGLIPHLRWAWPLYWLPYLLVPLAGTLLIRRMDAASFRRLVIAWAGMILVGGAFQLAFPAVAPWPDDPALSQRLFHESAAILPYATLPSMHVAHVAFATLVAGTISGRRTVLAIGLAGTLTVAVATLVLKEHLVLDALSGLVLAGVTWWWWRRPATA